MTKQVVDHRPNINDVHDLIEALNSFIGTAYAGGSTPDMINFDDPISLALIKETLTDGSIVFNIAARVAVSV